MTLLKWIGAIVILFWLAGVLLRLGGMLIHWLLLIAVIIFIVDIFSSRRKRT
jgi:predicted membrane protein